MSDRPPPAPVAAPAPSGRRSDPSHRVSGGGVDRVGGQRLTPLGTAFVVAAIVAVGLPRQDLDVALLGTALVLVVGSLLIGVIWPAVAVRRVRVEARSPGLGTVGDDLPVAVTVSGGAGGADVRILDPTGDWHHVIGDEAGDLVHRADRRGSFPLVRLEFRVTGPLGLSAAHRVHTVVLDHVVDIGPRPTPVDLAADPAPTAAQGATSPTATLAGEVVRAVRPYVSGDPAHLVHWPTSARTGSLVVREMEPPGHHRVALVVDLRGLGAETEAVASLAAGVARRVLAQGGEVVLATAEVDGPAVAPVRSPAQVGRRLARAVDGPPAAAPDRWPVLDVGAWWTGRRAWQPALDRADGSRVAITLPGASVAS